MRMSQLELEALLRKGNVTVAARVNVSGAVKEVLTDGEGLKLDVPRKKAPPRPKLTGSKLSLHYALKAICEKYALPLFEEQVFHEKRKWRLDYLIPLPGGPVGIEYEGLGFGKTGHTESDRYTDNCTKYNAAAAAGITVLRYTFSNWGQAVTDLENFFI